MSDTEQTVEEQPEKPATEAAPGASAPGGRSAPAAEAPRVEEDGLDGPEGSAEVSEFAQDADEDALRDDVDELVAVAAERDGYLALAQRTQADFENYRKRVAREAAAAHERGMAVLAKDLLPALDNLDRAIGAAAEEDPLLHGVRLVRSELATALARSGIESYSPAGEAFDPALHEAVATAPQLEDGPASGTVVEVYQAGYRLGSNIIRPARVVVAA